MRINTLDYLRGLMALSIMIYHYFSWTFHDYTSDYLLGILGVYGVSIFYIISGITLFHVYGSKLSMSSLSSFFLKRIVRILPLLWLSIFLNIFLFDQVYNVKTILLNVSGFFGFFDHANYITLGSWSIGNELVFYSIFPIIIILTRWKEFILELFFIISLCIAIYFAFGRLNSNHDLGAQWSEYINPFNQLFFFIGGMFIAKVIKNRRNNKVSFMLFIFCVIFTFLYSVKGDLINLVSAWNRLIFAFISFMISISFLLLNTTNIHKLIDWTLSKLGQISYSLYLMHAIVFWFIAKFINRTEMPVIFLTTCIIGTILLSHFLYNYFELRCINLGKRLLSKKIK